MSTTVSELEELAVRLKRQYQELDRIVEAMSDSSQDSIDAISEQLSTIKQTEAALRPIREEFRSTGDALPAHLQETTSETIEILKGLLPKLGQLEKTTLDSAKRLFPKIQESVRAVKMQSAYGANRARS